MASSLTKTDQLVLTEDFSNNSMEADLLASVCSNVTGEGSGGACDRKALGISLSTPILMMSAGILGNLLALLVLFTANKQARRTAFFPLLMAMAFIDLVGQSATGVIAIIVYANNLKWVGGRPLCVYHGFAMVFFSIITPLMVCSMSLERLLALRFSYFYQRAFTPRVVKGIIVGSILFTVFFCTWPFMGFGSYELQFPGSWCYLNYHRESLTDMIYALVFSGLNIVFIAFIIGCNGAVVWTLLKMRRLRHQMHSSPSAEFALQVKPRSRSSALHLEMETQMVWFLLAITVVFSCLWLPINVHILMNQITGKTDFKQDLISVRLASINQIIDPWMYIILRKNTFFKCLRRIKNYLTRGKETCKMSSLHSHHHQHSHHSAKNCKVSNVPRRQSCPPAVSYSVRNDSVVRDQAMDQLLPHEVFSSQSQPSASAPDYDMEMSLNGPLCDGGYELQVCLVDEQEGDERCEDNHEGKLGSAQSDGSARDSSTEIGTGDLISAGTSAEQQSGAACSVDDVNDSDCDKGRLDGFKIDVSDKAKSEGCGDFVNSEHGGQGVGTSGKTKRDDRNFDQAGVDIDTATAPNYRLGGLSHSKHAPDGFDLAGCYSSGSNKEERDMELCLLDETSGHSSRLKNACTSQILEGKMENCLVRCDPEQLSNGEQSSTSLSEVKHNTIPDKGRKGSVT
ncbi:uncharacterized protein [Littorina saxatilis]|uniref:G-protein coupled receptors family 1 profile domain-containing protein n=1 Tax=Littorina saxatilis TaxID=31220 RepID=A0AAN9B7X2_9CAEN